MQKSKAIIKSGVKGSSFATNMPSERKRSDTTTAIKQVSPVKAANAFESPCLFCQKNYTLESCTKYKALAHQERVEFLKTKGLCFGCLTQGHMSKTCKKRTVCKQCLQRHPDILHEEKEANKSTSVLTNGDSIPKEQVSGAQASISSCAS